MPDKPTRRIRKDQTQSSLRPSEIQFSMLREECALTYESTQPKSASSVESALGTPEIQIESALHSVEVSKPLRELLCRGPEENAELPGEQHRYLLGQLIGRGGMGSVHHGWDMQLHRSVAIKIIAKERQGHTPSLLRFLREARVASRLLHPGIVKIHDFDIDASGRAFIVMDLLVGHTLDQVIASQTVASDRNPALIASFLQVSQAIAYSHANGVIHRDIKPSNIMIGDFGVVSVLDWGLAKLINTPNVHRSTLDSLCDDSDWKSGDESLDAYPIDDVATQDLCQTGLGTIMGTPHYLAPEQARGEEVDFRADVFALGAILCEILTGKPPYAGNTLREVYDQSTAADLSGAQDRLDQCVAPGPLVVLAKHCLAPNPQDRPVDASGVVLPLKAYLDSGQRRAEQEMVRFFELSIDLFCIANLQGYFCRVNDNFSRVLGYSVEDLTSRQFIEFVHPEDQAKTIAEVERLARGEPTIQFVNRYRHSNGQYLWLEWTSRSIASEGTIYAVARNVSDRMQGRGLETPSAVD